jgi:hypothetical protein
MEAGLCWHLPGGEDITDVSSPGCPLGQEGPDREWGRRAYVETSQAVLGSLFGSLRYHTRGTGVVDIRRSPGGAICRRIYIWSRDTENDNALCKWDGEGRFEPPFCHEGNKSWMCGSHKIP